MSFKLRRTFRALISILSIIKTFFLRLVGAYKILSIWEKRIVIFFLGIFLVGLVILARQIYFKDTQPTPIVGGKISVAEVGDPKLINPIFARTNQDKDLSNLIFSGLFYWNEKGELTPDLVQKWDVSGDGKVYTFYLMPGVQWHDGVPLTSDDVIFTASLISDNNYNGPLKGLFSNVILEKVDDHTLRITLKEPYAPFLSNLTFGILPAHILANVPLSDMENDGFNLSPIGSGPYMIKNSQPSSSSSSSNKKQIVLDRNPNCQNRNSLISEITFMFYPDFNSALNAYRKGEVSVLTDIPDSSISDAQSIKDLKIEKLVPSSYVGLFFNLSNKFLKEKPVRQAIASGVNKQEIIDKFFSGQGKVVNGPILPGSLGYTNDVKIIPYDLAAGKNYLKQSDFSKVELNLVTSDEDDFVKTANYIKEQLAQENIKVNVITADNLSIQSDYVLPRNFDMLLLGENLGPDPDPFPFWDSSQIGSVKLNLTGFSNKDVDSLLEKARTATDPNVRKSNYEQFQKIIAEDTPSVFLFEPFEHLGVNESIKGASDAKIISSGDKFYQINNWYLKIGRKKK